jgi:hypothetical protein
MACCPRSCVVHEILGFQCSVDEVYALLGWYAACVGSCIQTFQDSLDCFTVEDGTNRLSQNIGKQL